MGAASHTPPRLIGRSPAFVQAMQLIERMARFSVPVLIHGETGTGKELAARAIHYRSDRQHGPFVPVNCGAMPEALIESELFGCERGAFTDARQARSGLIAAAEGGTLFLDELDALPPRAQVALLRFLQDYRYRPVGGTRECTGNVRIIAACSPRLSALVESGTFRDDLVFRLNVLALELAPLRDRPGDAVLLAEHFIAEHASRHALTPRRLAPPSIEWLERYAWPGNVRELDNRVQRALMLSDGSMLELAPSPARADATSPRADAAGPLRNYQAAREESLLAFERAYLQEVMQLAHGNVTHAARMAGKERRALGKLLKKHGFGKST